MRKHLLTRGIWAIAALGVTGFALAQQSSTGSSQSGNSQNSSQNGSAQSGNSQNGNSQNGSGQSSSALQSSDGSSGTSSGLSGGSDARGRHGRGMAARGGVDHHMVKCLINDNQEEVALAQLAQQRAQNEEVKKFAAQMQEDHTKFITKLQGVKGGSAGRTGLDSSSSSGSTNQTGQRSTTESSSDNGTSSATNQSGQSATSGTQSSAGQSNDASGGQATQSTGGLGNRSSTGTSLTGDDSNARSGRRGGARAGGGPNQFFQILDEVHQQCQQSKIRELSQKSGQQFDMAYMGIMVGAHMKMLDTLTVFNRHASAELQPILQEGIQTTQQHLAHAKEIHQRVEQGQNRSTASTR